MRLWSACGSSSWEEMLLPSAFPSGSETPPMGIGFWPRCSVLWTRKRALCAELLEVTGALSRDSQSRKNPYSLIGFATVVFGGSETNFFFPARVSCSPGWSWTCKIAKDDLELLTLLPLLPRC